MPLWKCPKTIIWLIAFSPPRKACHFVSFNKYLYRGLLVCTALVELSGTMHDIHLPGSISCGLGSHLAAALGWKAWPAKLWENSWLVQLLCCWALPWLPLTRPVPACTPIRHQTREHLSEATAVIEDSAGSTAVPSPCGVACALHHTSLVPCTVLHKHQWDPSEAMKRLPPCHPRSPSLGL